MAALDDLKKALANIDAQLEELAAQYGRVAYEALTGQPAGLEKLNTLKNERAHLESARLDFEAAVVFAEHREGTGK